MGDVVFAIAFWVFTLLTLGGGLAVVTVRNLFHAALFLLVSLFGVAGLFVLLVAPFLAAIQVLVYMGAIGILIIFAIMLTRGMMRLEHPFNSQAVAGGAVALLVFVGLVLVVTPLADEIGLAEVNIPAEIIEEDDPADVDYETVSEMGRVIADRNGFVLPFELASILLTAAMIGAIVVAREDEA
ncbi:MAG: NADH-quinone oxidoreductase subunit J [Anaerolineae bacterium]|nr:NADH-quinone oxidoreductase subunit J [Anaerolineae bacterium]